MDGNSFKFAGLAIPLLRCLPVESKMKNARRMRAARIANTGEYIAGQKRKAYSPKANSSAIKYIYSEQERIDGEAPLVISIYCAEA